MYSTANIKQGTLVFDIMKRSVGFGCICIQEHVGRLGRGKYNVPVPSRASVEERKEDWLTKCEQELAVVIRMP